MHTNFKTVLWYFTRLEIHLPSKGMNAHSSQIHTFEATSTAPSLWLDLGSLPFLSILVKDSTDHSVHKPGAWKSSLLPDLSLSPMSNPLLFLPIFSPKYLSNLSVFCHLLHHTAITWTSVITSYLWPLIHSPQSKQESLLVMQFQSHQAPTSDPFEAIRIRIEIFTVAWEALCRVALLPVFVSCNSPLPRTQPVLASGPSQMHFSLAGMFSAKPFCSS